MRIQNYMNIELAPGDEVISTTQFRDFVLVITRRGVVYKITYDENER